MKKLLIGLGIILVLVVLAVVLIPFLIPAERLETEIEARASEALGRQVTIDGAPDISVIPVALDVSGLTVANAEGFDAPYLLRVGEARLGVRLLPLLSGRVEITRFDLDAPEINLQATPEGEANWVLGETQEEEEAAALPDLRLGTVRVTDGRITYDGGTGQTYEMADADITLRSPSLDETLEAEGTMTLEGRPARFDASLTTPRSLVENAAAEMALNAALGENTVEASGQLGEAMAFAGTLDVNLTQLRDLMALAGAEAPAGPGFERLALAGEVSGDAERVTFAEGTRIGFDAIEATGNLTLDVSGERPSASGRFETEMLDLRPYVPTEEAPEPEEDAPFPPWSEEPIDLSALQSADADLSFRAGAIVLPTVRVGESEARLVLNEGRMEMQLERMALYEGSGSGTLTVDGAGQTPLVSADFALSGVGMQGLAADLAGTDRLTGTGDVRIDVMTTGNSQADFVRGLGGDVVVELADGAVQGVDLGRIGRAALGVVSQLRQGGANVANLAGTVAGVTGGATGPEASTPFAQFLLDLSIDGGVATTDAFTLDGPYYAMVGDGSVNLPQQTVDLTLTPSVSAADGEARRELPAPIKVGGTFSDPKIALDAAPLVQGAAREQVRGVLERQGIDVPEGQSLEDTVRQGASEGLGRLLGRRNRDAGETEETPQDE